MATRIARFNLMFTADSTAIRRVFARVRGDFRRLSQSLTSFAQNFVFVTEAFNRASDFINRFRGEIDELGKAADRLQLDPRFLQSFQITGELTGTTVERVNKGLSDLQKRIGEFRADIAGQQTRDAFELLGVAPDRGTFEDNVRQVVDGLAAIDDQTQKAAVANALFGRSGREMLLAFDNNLLDQAADDLERWGSLTREEIKRVEDFNDMITRLTAQTKILAQTIVADVVPALTEFEGLASSVLQVTRDLKPAFAGAGTAAALFAKQFTGPAAALAGTFGTDQLAKSLDQLDRELTKVTAKLIESGLYGPPPGTDTTAADEARRRADELDRLGEQAAAEAARVAQSQPWVSDEITRQLAAVSFRGFAQNFQANIRSVFERERQQNPFMSAVLSLSGAGVVRAGSVQAAQYQARNAQKRQISLLTKIEQNTAAAAQPIEIVDRAL